MLEHSNLHHETSPNPYVPVVPDHRVATPVPRRSQDCRILHLVNGQHFAGAERVQMHLGNRLPEFGCTADFACLVPGRFADQFDLASSKLIRAPMRNRFDVGVTARLISQIDADSYHCLHAHTPRTAMIARPLAKRLGIPWVYHVHSPTARDSTKRFSNQINSWVERWSIATADHLITVSSSLKRQMIEDGWPADRVTVVHNGVPACRPDRQSIPTPQSNWQLGMVALMRPRKGLEIAIHALGRLRDAGIPVTLRCIGPFETEAYEGEIRKLIDRLRLREAITLCGFTRDVTTQLGQIDALVLPSLHGEGMPMVVLEAMAAGLPVVATRVEGTPEAIQHGCQGLLAEPNDVDSLAKQIRDLVTGVYDWSTMSAAATRRHAECFSDRAMAEATAKIYRSL
jgi:glycosyltransferase involved in cell wall biosynthesis